MNTSTLLSPTEAAEHLNISERILYAFRRYGGGPAFCRLGHRTVRYEKASLDAWIASVRTSEVRSLHIEPTHVAS